VGTGGWHCWAQVGALLGHRCVTLQSGTGGCIAGHRWVELVGTLLGTDHQGTDHQCPDDCVRKVQPRTGTCISL
ncbi:unnamed protein product, partial [Staurois parvus]